MMQWNFEHLMRSRFIRSSHMCRLTLEIDSHIMFFRFLIIVSICVHCV